MAALGNTPIQLYYSNTAGNSPTAANLISGELAINMADGVLYYKNASNNVSILASNSAVSTATNASANTITLQGGLNTANANIAYIFGINNTQNTWISSNAVYTQAAFDRANTKFSSSGGTISGSVTIQSDLTVTGNISFTGNATTVQITGNTGQFFGYASNGFNALYAGIPTGYFIEPQVTFQVSSNFNGYSGLNMQNINAGGNSSSDLFITADNGTINDGFVDLGMGSSNYNYPGYTLIGKNDGYLFTTGNTTTGGGNMIIGTGLPNDVIFSVNGLNTGNEVARFKYNVGLVVKQPITFADSTTQNTAAAPHAFTQAAYNQANTATNNTIALTGVNLTQNTWIASNAAFTQAAFNQANTATNNTIAIQGVDTYQNTQIAIVQGGLNTANANIASIFGIDNTQNTWIASNAAFTQAAFNQANTDVTSITLSNPGTYGGATNVAVITVSANGRITAISNTAISAGGGSGGSSSGYLANSVIFANSTGYLSNTSSLSFFASNNTLQVTGNVIVTGTIGGISPRTFNVATSATPTPNASNTDQYILSSFGQVGGGTIQIPTGTANDGQRLMIRIKDSGNANALGWITTSGGYRAIGVTLPTTTVAGKVLYVGCIYNSQDAYWDVVSVAQQ